MIDILCGDCQQVYMGQTDRNFACRLKEHRRAFKNIDEIRSAVAEHVFNTGHSVDRGNAPVIDMCLHHHTFVTGIMAYNKQEESCEHRAGPSFNDSLHGQ